MEPQLHNPKLHNSRLRRRTGLALALLLAALLPQPLPAQDDEAADAAESTEAIVDECDWELEDQEIQEQTREVLRSWSCHSFRWFDSLWGDSHDFPEDQVAGWAIAGLEYREYDGFDPRLRLRVRAPLPNMNNRWDLILGRVDETSYVSDTEIENKDFFNPGAVSVQDDEPEWLLGLGHRGRERKRGWDWSAGVRLRVPPRPYAKVQYYWNKAFSEDTSLSFRQTFFWRSDDGLGTTSRAMFSQDLNPGNVFRWEAIATYSEETLGTEWYFGHTWYHRISGENAISLLTFAQGETDYEVSLKDVGFNLIWRRPFTRDWLYLSMGPSMTWPRELKSEKREMSLGFGVWVEVKFGKWRY